MHIRPCSRSFGFFWFICLVRREVAVVLDLALP
nr:MAG TPA: hypothetical protein [Caudoviricetes sp.]